jgi:hypothetical protein
VSKVIKLNTVISDGSRSLFQFYPLSTFLNKGILLCYSSQCPLHFSKAVLDWRKWSVHTLQALVRNFLLINNFTTWSLVLQRSLLFWVFFFRTNLNVTSLTSLPMDVSEVRVNSVKKTHAHKHNGGRTPAVN